MAKGSAVATGSASDGMDGYVPLGGGLLDAEIVGDGSEGFTVETPHGNSGMEEISGDPDTEELPIDPDSDEAETEEAEGEFEPEVDPIEAKDKGARYWQSKHDKVAAEAAKLQGLAGYETVIKRLQEDPEAAKMLMEHWTKPAPEAPKEPELVEPEAPEDFDINLISVPGTSSQKYWKAQREFDRQIARRDAMSAARDAAAETTRPFVQAQQAARAQQELVAVLSKTELPVEEYDAFTKWNPTREEHAAILAKAYLESKGVKVKDKVKAESKVEEFRKVKENGEKAGAVRKVKGEGSTAPLTDEQGFMASLKAAAGNSHYKA